jgi:hypothetical protein
MKSFYQFISENLNTPQDEYDDLINRLVDPDSMVQYSAMQELEFLYSNDQIKEILKTLSSKLNIDFSIFNLDENLLMQLEFISMNLTMNSGNKDDAVSTKYYSEFLKTNKIKSLLNLKTFHGDLDLDLSSVEDLGDLTEIHGDLKLFNCKVSTLKNLEYIQKSLMLNYSNIEDLGRLKEVGKSLFTYNSILTSLGSLEKIGDTLFLQASNNLKNISSLKYCGNIHGKFSNLDSLDNIEEMEMLYNEDDWLKSLGKLKKISSLLLFENSKISTLGNLKQVDTLTIDNANLMDLGDLEEVDYLTITEKSTGLTSLGNIKKIRSLKQLSSTILDLGELEEITVLYTKELSNHALLNQLIAKSKYQY